jgi:Mrp family chromosome partitioning ATPase
MSTNQAFIKAYRRDPPRTATPMPTATRPLRQLAPQGAAAAPLAALQSSVEIVTADISWPAPPAAVSTSTHSSGKRPLSSFAAGQTFEPAPIVEPTFQPETLLSAFRWPRVCRELWDEHSTEYERVAQLMLDRCNREPGRGGVIGVCSLHAGDGATTALLCLAVALAARKQSLILVDGNFRAPRIAGVLGAQPNTSWQDVLEHGLPVAEAVIRAEKDGVDILPLDVRDQTAREPNGAKLAAGLQTSITAGVLRYAYEIVLVDLGAILAPRSFATMNHLIRKMRIHTAVAITDPKHAETDDLTIAGELLDETGCELLGVIENRTNTAS